MKRTEKYRVQSRLNHETKNPFHNLDPLGGKEELVSRGIAPARPSMARGGSISTKDGAGTDGPNNICEACSKTFTSASALRRHNMSKHLQLGVKYQCSICAMQYKTKWSLSTHISRYHRPASEKIVRKKSAANKSASDSLIAQEVANANSQGQSQTEFVVVKNE